MVDLLTVLGNIAAFLGVQFLLGKRGSFPYGLLVGFSLVKITLLVIVSDIIQAFLLLNFFDFFARKVPWLKKKVGSCDTPRPAAAGKGVWNRVKRWGAPGLVAVAALPYGGGALTGSILALSMDVEKKKAFYFLITGCIIGSVIFYFGCSALT